MGQRRTALRKRARQHVSARGRDVRRMLKPYASRNVLFTCSNGWLIEDCAPIDWRLEDELMGGRLCAMGKEIVLEAFSLREPDGTPHATIIKFRSSGNCVSFGRSNRPPKKEYAELIREWYAENGLAERA